MTDKTTCVMETISVVGQDCPEPRSLDILQHVFHLKKFLPKQQKIIVNILEGRDLIALLPPSSGRSLCYQLAAFMTKGVTVVVSPLINSFKDQLSYLKKLGIPALVFCHQTTEEIRSFLFKDLCQRPQPVCKIIYTTPEMITTSNQIQPFFRQLFDDHLLSRFIIDEVHCISNWSHDFRPNYLDLKQLKTLFPKVQIVSFTSTATPRTQMDIVLQLGLKTVYMHRQSSIRSNLSYQIHLKHKRTIVHEMASLIRNQYKGQSGLIYCSSRQSCEEITSQLTEFGVSAEFIHSGLIQELKDQIQKRWSQNHTLVLVITGIYDINIKKPDIRFVFHYTLPKSLEEYYLEAGQAGRDGLPADCLLFYSNVDRIKIEQTIKNEMQVRTTNDLKLFDVMINYCQNDIDCRKRQIAVYLGETTKYDCREVLGKGEICNICDNCRRLASPKIIAGGCGPPQHQYYDLNHYLYQIQNLLIPSRKIEPNDLVKQLTTIVPFSNTEIHRLISYLIVEGCLRLKVTIENHHLNEFYEVIKPITQLTLETGKSRDIVHSLHRHMHRSISLPDRPLNKLLSSAHQSPRSDGSIHHEGIPKNQPSVIKKISFSGDNHKQ